MAFPGDFWCVTGDDFSVDQFLNIPNDDGSFLEDEEKYSPSLSISSHDPIDDNHSDFSPDFSIPVDDVQELELWSHLMDDSVSEATFACPKTIVDVRNAKSGFYVRKRVQPGKQRACWGVVFIGSTVPVKPRSKRLRPAGIRAWKSFRLVEFSINRSTGSRDGGSPVFQRRCRHCQVTKTPQWRAGPDGPKTLCNACGVRFKSGRLYPEYRPACSPTFSKEVHSNSHREVLEMRLRKETTSESLAGSEPGESVRV